RAPPLEEPGVSRRCRPGSRRWAVTSSTDRAAGPRTIYGLLVAVLAMVPLAEHPARADGAIEPIYNVKLQPPTLQNEGDTHLAYTLGLVRSGMRETKTFLLPAFKDVYMLVTGDSTLRYEFRSPSGKRFVPGESHEQEGFKPGGMKGFEILYF